ncbi:MAG: NUDIX domain-containing protein [Pseudodesulfovibrio sp.]|jgi:8-oxo-dGTP diphosphatase|uniref:8-oxo-dGTP diphosphatase n=1 Tax=Pseudodesulfovibrio indicus TaxID=1716143 RepID=A0A126QRG5_9BACT|nr:NUDIX hydrolase [Pseudodesulfovibrio indicus]AMK12296.1 NUDIX hydrolase [Pseudodesulfovibrio indicus]TDT90574.1 8-oxo-dGTP diphosphatase [Pseudodesulfovibrio indicus]
MGKIRACPHCGGEIEVYRNPTPTVDVVIVMDCPGGGEGVVLIERANPPLGWALPGGFVDYGESCERAAVREMREETGLDVNLTGLLGVYSDPDRDPRQHTMSVVYTGKPEDPSRLAAGDDAAKARVFPMGRWPDLVFDHAKILADFLALRERAGCPD